MKDQFKIIKDESVSNISFSFILIFCKKQQNNNK